MRFLLRLLLLLAFGSYFLNHYFPAIRESLWGLHSANNSVPAITEGPLQSRSAQSTLPAGALPRHDLTPGASDPRVTQSNIRYTICRRGYTATVRPPFEYTNAMKHRLMRAYGVTGSIHDYELDHLISLGVGGCPDCEANLWPQSRTVFPGAREKDEVEGYLHHQVCSGALSLAEAQREIASDWYAVYRRIHRQTTGRRQGEE